MPLNDQHHGAGSRSRARRLGHLFALFALLAAASALLAACGGSSDSGTATAAETGGSAESEKELTMGVSLISQQIPVLAEITKEFEEAGAAKGYETIVTDPNNDATKQVQEVRSLIERHVDGLAVGAINSKAMEPVLAEAVEAGIPTVLVGIPPLKSRRGLLTVNFDWGAYGYLVGESFAKCMNEKFGGKGEVALITTTALGGPVVIERMEGEREAIEKLAPEVEIVAEGDAKSNRVKAVEVARTMLQAHPDISGFTGIGDSEVLGAIQAYREAGNDPKEGCFVGLDGSEEGVKALEEGTLYAEWDPQYGNWMKVASVALPEMARDAESGFWSASTVLFAPAEAQTK
jgi:ribose transport system substrate-binding protein